VQKGSHNEQASKQTSLGIFLGDEGTPILFQRRTLAIITLLLIAIISAYVITTQLYDIPWTFEAGPFQDWVGDRGVWAPIVFIFVMAFSVLFAPIPNSPIFLAAGLAWGSALGSVYCMIGLLLGSSLAFLLARRLGRKHLPTLVGRKTAQRLDSLTDRMGNGLIFWARMLPVINFDWISYLAGLTPINFQRFFIYSTLGMLLPTVIAVVAGDSIGKDIRITLIIGSIWIGGIVLSGLFFWYRSQVSQGKKITIGDPTTF
jgi:uncharacterized membrane protein YdjX (TVP38/TMEM64 family)